jgi:AcrR family transcriptional regulator
VLTQIASTPVSTTTDSKRSRRARALPPDERRTAIIRATLPLLLEHAEMVTTRQIAEAAGIAEGTIFRVFADKDEVIAAVIDEAIDPTSIEEALGALDLTAPLDVVLVRVIELLQERTIKIWRLMSSVGARFHERVRQPMTDSPAIGSLFERHRAELAIEPTAAGRLLRALTLSTTHPMLVDEPLPPAEIASLFLHGVSRGLPC